MFTGPIEPYAGDELRLQVLYDRERGNTRGLDFDLHGLQTLYPTDPDIRAQVASFENGEHQKAVSGLGDGTHEPNLTVTSALQPIDGREFYETQSRSEPTSVRAVCMNQIIAGSDDDRDRAKNGPFLMSYVVLDASTRADWVRRIRSASAAIPARATFRLVDQVNYTCTLPGVRSMDAESTLLGGRMWRIRFVTGSLRGSEVLWRPSVTSYFNDDGPQCFQDATYGACPLVRR